MRCPICKQPVEQAGDYRPFCSDRCKLIDLDNWFAGRYRISSPVRESADQLLAQEAASDDLVEDPIEGDPE